MFETFSHVNKPKIIWSLDDHLDPWSVANSFLMRHSAFCEEIFRQIEEDFSRRRSVHVARDDEDRNLTMRWRKRSSKNGRRGGI
jgi:hypothetical protein